MNFVVLSAALSSMNTNLYLAGRMAFSLARSGDAPARLGALNRDGAPMAAILVSAAGVLAAAALSVFTPKANNDLFGISLFGAIFVWIVILLSHLGFRRRHAGVELLVKTPFFPVPQVVGLVLLAAILVTMGLDTEFWNISWIVGIPWLAALTAVYVARRIAARGVSPTKAA
jgi:L-asparagine transporter-like permease